jgi:hypothetical protein
VFRQRWLGLWWRRLRRRSQPHRISWARTLALGDRWLPQPRVLHPYPVVRFAARCPREEPDALMSARPGPSGGYRASGIPTGISKCPATGPAPPLRRH